MTHTNVAVQERISWYSERIEFVVPVWNKLYFKRDWITKTLAIPEMYPGMHKILKSFQKGDLGAFRKRSVGWETGRPNLITNLYHKLYPCKLSLFYFPINFCCTQFNAFSNCSFSLRWVLSRTNASAACLRGLTSL